MTKIVNEIPEELEMEGEEVEVSTEESKASKPEKSTADVERVVQEEPRAAEPEIEIEEEDDTPLEDQGKEPLPQKIVDELENDKIILIALNNVWHSLKKFITMKDVLKNKLIEKGKKLFGMQDILLLKTNN
jgi:hypothetical protein